MNGPLNVSAMQKRHANAKRSSLPDLELRLAKSLWHELPYRSLGPGSSMRRIVSSYADSFNILSHCCAEWSRFVEAIARCAVYERPAAMPDGAVKVRETIDAILKKVDYGIRLQPSVVTAQLVAQPSKTVYEALEDDLVNRISRIITHVFAVLHKGFQQAWYGPISWTGETTCEFIYFTSPILFLGTTQETEATAKSLKTVTRHRFQHRRGYHQQHLMCAKMASGLPPSGLLPPRIRHLVESLPRFLESVVSTVDGLLVAERIVEWDEGTSETTHEVVLPHPRLAADPAIVVGPYVLTGWSDRDFDGDNKSFALNSRRWVHRTWMTLTR